MEIDNYTSNTHFTYCKATDRPTQFNEHARLELKRTAASLHVVATSTPVQN